MKYSKIRKMDISNGPGIRVSLFTQGCDNHCPGCFNPETWSYSGGKDFTPKEELLITQLCDNEHYAGLSILGGEPLSITNLETLEHLIKEFRKTCPDKTIWLWTGYTIERLSKRQTKLIQMCDYIVDGPFKIGQKNLNLYYAGSTNQRLWKVLDNGMFVQEKMPVKNEGKI